MAQLTRENTNGQPMREGGVYRHKETGAEVIAIATERFGNPQADAYVRLGYEYVGPVESKVDKEAVASIPDPHAAPLASPAGTKTVAELEAELEAAKARLAELDSRKEEAEKVNKVAENSVANSNPAGKKGTK